MVKELRTEFKNDNFDYYEGGFNFNPFKKKSTSKYEFTHKSQDILNKYGNCPIISLQIYRTPIYEWINKAFQIISLGKWNKLRKKYNFDKMFHLALVATVSCENKQTNKTKIHNVLIEKNETILISDYYQTNKDTEIYPINVDKIYTINQMLEKTLKDVGNEKFYLYDGLRNNCQYFIRYILKSNYLYTKHINEFLFQDIKKIVEELPPYFKTFQKKITDIASFVKRKTGGNDEMYNILPYNDNINNNFLINPNNNEINNDRKKRNIKCVSGSHSSNDNIKIKVCPITGGNCKCEKNKDKDYNDIKNFVENMLKKND
tara:strand:+ start:114 stop:1064 length:951 start_codon:yes stop_codon:yes gene_type:complete